MQSLQKSDLCLLRDIEKCLSMALLSLEKLNEKIKDDRKLSKYLYDQVDTYKNLKTELVNAFSKIEEKPKDVGFWADMMLASSIKMETMKDKSDNHIADMMVQGTNMGIIEITRSLNECGDKSSNPAKKLAYDTLFALNSFDADMKNFL